MSTKTDVREMKHPSTSILRVMADDKSLQLLKIIANNSDDAQKLSSESINTQFLLKQVKLTRKQYYSRISSLTSNGLIRRSSGRYILTSLGKVANNIYSLVEQAIHDHWKLKAIDALETKSSSGIREEERKKIVDMLIDNYRLKEILTGRNFHNEQVNQHAYSAGDIKTAAKLSQMTMLSRINEI